MKFEDILEIKNGRNQRAVENPRGKYPIYGSGGIMGYADDYICDAYTVIIGRKGNINNPIFVEEPFWNVDTAFGLSANTDVILPRFLYYFCKKFDFERLNKTVTIPSLTKSDLLKIEIEPPNLLQQRDIVERLTKIERIIALRKLELKLLDELIRARFVELFGDMFLNTMSWNEEPLEEMANVVSGITKGRKLKAQCTTEVPYMAVSNVKDGYIDWTTVKTIEATEQEINQYRLLPEDVLMTEGGDPDKLGRGAIIKEPLENCIHQNHIFRVRLNETVILPEFFAEYLRHQKSKRYFLGCAKQTTGIASINMRQLKALPVLLPPLELQNQFADFVKVVDKSKFTKTFRPL
ncbi:MAG: restriction endonuclease subunit S [Clostridium sp.]|nr:restriction endonuclease subunit S [Clostridium sp.]